MESPDWVEIRLPRSNADALWVINVAVYVGLLYFVIRGIAGEGSSAGAGVLICSPLALVFGYRLWVSLKMRVVADDSGLLVRNAIGGMQSFSWSEVEDFRVAEFQTRSTRAAVFVLLRERPMLVLDVTRRPKLSDETRAELEGYARGLRYVARTWVR